MSPGFEWPCSESGPLAGSGIALVSQWVACGGGGGHWRALGRDTEAGGRRTYAAGVVARGEEATGVKEGGGCRERIAHAAVDKRDACAAGYGLVMVERTLISRPPGGTCSMGASSRESLSQDWTQHSALPISHHSLFAIPQQYSLPAVLSWLSAVILRCKVCYLGTHESPIIYFLFADTARLVSPRAPHLHNSDPPSEDSEADDTCCVHLPDDWTHL